MKLNENRVVEQLANDEKLNPDEVLRTMRERIRSMLNLAYVPFRAPLNEAEVVCIFSLCEALYEGPGQNVLIKTRFRMGDIDAYKKTGEVPIEVLRMFQIGFTFEQIPGTHRTSYREGCLLQAKEPMRGELKHALIGGAKFHGCVA